ncbi:hypothetical protein KU48_12650 [Bacillus safensis]|nr:hypothetical protein KU48_12650 [Bacillus safensis]
MHPSNPENHLLRKKKWHMIQTKQELQVQMVSLTYLKAFFHSFSIDNFNFFSQFLWYDFENRESKGAEEWNV